jgi:hypothetical protein
VIKLLLTTLVVLAPVARADAASWTVVPAGADRQDYRYTVNPGGQVEDGLVVVNHGTGELRLALRATGAWARVDQDALTVPAGESVQLPFSITVPSDATPGDHVGGLVTSAGAERVAVPIRLRVGGPLRPRLAVEHVQVEGDKVTYTVHNTGNAILGARQTVSLAGPLGRVDALAPGERRTVSVRVRSGTFALRRTATVTVTPLLTDAAGSTAPLGAVKATGHAWRVPSWLLLLLLAAGAGTVVRRARTRSRRGARAAR